jgi:hypothetical protein
MAFEPITKIDPDQKEQVQVAPEPEPQGQQPAPQVTEPKKDETPLIQRVAKFMETNDPVTTGVPVEDDFKFDINEIQKIEDPKARELAEKAYKSFQRGFNKKFQDLAELRKSLESQGGTWTPDRINKLLNDPSFLQAAQQVAGTTNPQTSGLTDEEWSALNDKEKAQLTGMQNKINQLEQFNMTALKTQQDASLKQTYANYNPQQVDTLLSDMMSNRIQATREHLWKVIDYEPAVDRAYRLGRQDERAGTSDRVSAISAQGVTAQPNQTIQPEKEESNLNFWKRIASKRLAESKSGQQQRM